MGKKIVSSRRIGNRRSMSGWNATRAGFTVRQMLTGIHPQPFSL
jgi:hypothetical protein